MHKIHVKNISRKYRGVFASAKIKKGEVIEVCHVVVIPHKDRKLIDKTHLISYYFYWGSKNQPAIALGFGSLYNHSYHPNAEYDQNVKKRVIVFKAIKDIKKGEEIKTNYNGDHDNKDEVWFKVKY
jgi:SET domain-containing protein